ncbi:hypothetical protein CFBP5875_03300 [Agrobacterium pusense]|jgi:hypothetical protein|uniref:Uncharacterized protein n=2 Tax=Hyphomicrobiales TaxID=356 RepID=A0AA44EM87_9HYPH|nr:MULTISPECIES: hypothetical protein [Rhizobium/Agrobacterium group]AMD61214.1 hypothetical protein AWN88_24320 [Agrobacterium tumefaciens]AUC09264.1 hypothetical protein BLX90_02990 [Rhizobium sp. Y9]EKJ93875.1 hypothetical protein C241_22851 [Bradyrhizobium lupini HPC(L)]KIV68809.1 hypothetical protein SZ54_0326 [Rhizobium sp. UR51a]MBB2904482.1 hypothetical protein [Rhizobium sp. RAS22]MBM7321600.1 hypothetical protein [Agrobacterium sp. S2]MDP9732684.1 hypothetical protein [Rhizobium sp
MDRKKILPSNEDAMDEDLLDLDIDALPAKGEIPQFIEQEIEEEEAESEDDPYQESDEALPDDAEERVINRNPSREGGAFDEV